MCILHAPFFVAHVLAPATGYPADGYSFIYIYLIHLSSIFYVLLGFFFLRKVLLRYFTDNITAVVIMVTALTTNLYYFTVYNSPMVHVYLFSLYVQQHEKQTVLFAVLIGLGTGLITLIRSVEIFCLFIPILWRVTSLVALVKRFTVLVTSPYFYVAIGVFILVRVPQLLYWKWLTGDFLYYSYEEEGFDFSNPRIKGGLLSFKNGWLIYIPVMSLALVGLRLLLQKGKRDLLLPIYLFLPIHIFILPTLGGAGTILMVLTHAQW